MKIKEKIFNVFVIIFLDMFLKLLYQNHFIFLFLTEKIYPKNSFIRFYKTLNMLLINLMSELIPSGQFDFSC